MSNSSLYIADKVIVVSTFIIIIHVKADILSGFEDVFNRKGLTKVRVDIVFYGLCPAQRCEMLLSEITFV